MAVARFLVKRGIAAAVAKAGNKPVWRHLVRLAALAHPTEAHKSLRVSLPAKTGER